MRKIIGLAIGLAIAMTTAAHAQVSLDAAHPTAIADILNWRGEKQAKGFRDIEHIFKTNTVKRGAKVHRLPVAAKPIAPTFTYDGKTWTIDAYMQAYRVSGLLVLKDGKIVLEKYALGRKPTDRWTSFSVAKSVTSTLVGAAIQDGKIRSIDDPVTRYVPELKGSAYEGVTVRQMLMMSSGVKWNENYTDPNSDVAKAGGSVTEPGINPMVSYLRKLPRANPPGTKWNYNTGETDLVGVLISKATGEGLAQYASEKIWKPYGMERDAVWMTDPGGQERGGTGISMTLRDYARLGLFIAGGGVAHGKKVVPNWWVADATKREIDNGLGGYGYFWWIRPNGAYEAVGIFGQSITTFPNEHLIIVQNAAWPAAGGKELSAARNAMLEGVRAAVK
ncbi:serine hydrolase [Phenylobacterium sp.]|jgi:CubicO group peptidase (beta-lactamase class C family)|uniref:serine hydrolase domain-containing protein n=1 Tax=Phenylobacterium sp. TaxID=1871053 RepID=UPI002E3059CC|nr:serine hydrolase [Phenylobacterium sp.]HEX3365498.1 serine hydrolase [Phenylobacterium sp.]